MDIIIVNHLLFCLMIFVHIVCGDRQDVCTGEEFKGQCPGNQVMLVDSALYGRMKLGNCVESDLGHLGCQNDVHFLVDSWCSGHKECQFVVPYNPPRESLNTYNTQCSKDLALYLEVDHHCVQVQSPDTCHISSGGTGYLSNHVTRTRCGRPHAPWEIQVRPGQNVELWLLDFGALTRRQNSVHTICEERLGYVTEETLGVNFTICGTQERQRIAYASKTNKIKIYLSQRDAEMPRFLFEYKVIGCPEPLPPSNAWHRREGSKAVIGCDSDDREWHLHCNGASWEGHIGNCTNIKKKIAPINPEEQNLPFSTIILLTGVVCAAILLIIIVVVAGTIYIKKQSINHDMKLRSEYDVATLAHHPAYTLNKNPGYDTNTMKSNMPQNPNCEDSQPLVHVLDKTLSAPGGTPTVGTAGTIRLGCACNTLPRPPYINNRENIHGDLLQ